MKNTYISTFISLLGGLFAGWVDMNNNEVQAAVLVVLVVAGIAGLIRPRGAWRWGLIAGVGVPAAYVLASVFHVHYLLWPQPNISAALIAIIPGMIGAYSGALVRKFWTKA